jgi:anti-anti-sigma regulatory factor
MRSKKKKTACIVWSGTVGIEQANNLKQELLGVIDKYDEVSVNLSAVEDIDVSAIQILAAAKKECDSKGCTFSISGTVPESILILLNPIL